LKLTDYKPTFFKTLTTQTTPLLRATAQKKIKKNLHPLKIFNAYAQVAHLLLPLGWLCAVAAKQNVPLLHRFIWLRCMFLNSIFHYFVVNK